MTEAEGTIVFEAHRKPEFGASGVLLIDVAFSSPDSSMFPIGEGVAEAALGADLMLPQTADVNNRMVVAMADGVRSVRFEVNVVNDTR